MPRTLQTLLHFSTVQEASFYDVFEDDVQCKLCERRCVIKQNNKGHCQTRVNIKGKLYTLTYGNLSAIESRPIEIKPFFHFWPGSTALTFSTWSCNFDCPWCQNFHLSKTPPNPKTAIFYSPEQIVNEASSRNDEGLCASFQEPTLLTEWALKVFEKGKQKGLYCCYVSNGYMTQEALEQLTMKGLDAIKIDIKGDEEVYKKYCGNIDVEKIWKNANKAKKMNLHIEIVNLIIPRLNDNEKCLEWIIEKHLKEVGPDTPLHFTKYSPAYKFYTPPTKIQSLEKAYAMAKKAGVLFPYIGNIPGHKFENTYCPNCNETLIQRYGPNIIKYRITTTKKCPNCGQSIPIQGNYIEKACTKF